MGKTVTNDALAQMLAALDKKFDERHADNIKRLERIETQTILTNGRVSAHDTEISVIKALMTERQSVAAVQEQKPRTVLKIGGGTGLGVALTKLWEIVSK